MQAAQRLAARRALERLEHQPDLVLIDGPWNFLDEPGAKTIAGGDRTSLSIAAASIVAKVSRDRVMRRLAVEFPWYGFEDNKGYPAPRHRAALQWVGPSVLHRRSWAFMEKLVGSWPPPKE
jgi:ribonuclease HII